MSINSKEHILGFLQFRRMFARRVGWVKSIEVNAFKSCSSPRNSGPLIHGALQNGCRAELLQYGSCSSAGLLPKDLRKSRTARSPRTSLFSRTEQPNRSLAGSKFSGTYLSAQAPDRVDFSCHETSGLKFWRKASHAGLSSFASCIAPATFLQPRSQRYPLGKWKLSPASSGFFLLRPPAPVSDARTGPGAE